MHLAAVHRAYEQEDHAQVVRLATEMVRTGTADQQDLLFVCRLGHRAAVHRHNGYSARMFADKMLELAGTDTDLLAEGHYRKGVAEWWCGDATMSIYHYRQYLLLVPELPPQLSRFIGPAHYNLGLAYRMHKDHARAIFHLEEAMEYYTPGSQPWLQTSLDIIWTQLTIGHVTMAGRQLDQLQDLAQHDDAWLRQEYLTARAYHAWKTDQRQVAGQLCTQILANGDDHHRGHAAWIAGEMAAEDGDMEAARGALNVALRLAEITQDPLILHEASELNRKIRQLGG